MGSGYIQRVNIMWTYFWVPLFLCVYQKYTFLISCAIITVRVIIYIEKYIWFIIKNEYNRYKLTISFTEYAQIDINVAHSIKDDNKNFIDSLHWHYSREGGVNYI